jgi:hypothetical protein
MPAPLTVAYTVSKKKRERYFPCLASAPPHRLSFARHLCRWGRSLRVANPQRLVGGQEDLCLRLPSSPRPDVELPRVQLTIA